MARLTKILLIGALSLVAIQGLTQEAPDPPRTLAVAETRVVTSELGGITTTPLSCDSDGNVYLRKYGENGPDPAVLKISSSGKKLATFSLSSVMEPRFRAPGTFFVAPNNELYQVGWNDEGVYVVTFSGDGSVKGKTKLDLKFTPSKLAAFPSGEFLISGLESQRESGDEVVTKTINAILSADGKMKRPITLAGDADADQAAAVRDSTYTGPLGGSNRAVTLGELAAGEDGNMYLLRRVSPAVIYVISPAGEVVRKITVTAPNRNDMPSAFQLNRNRLAVMFRDNETKKAIYKVVDTSDGREVAVYESQGLGGAFACYSAEKNRFTFLATEKGKLALRHAEPQ